MTAQTEVQQWAMRVRGTKGGFLTSHESRHAENVLIGRKDA